MNNMTNMTWSRRPSRALLIVGVLELVLGTGFIVGSFAIPFVGTGFLITGVILSGVGVVMLLVGAKATARYGEAQRLKAQGLDGAASITSMTQTGVTLNEQPQVRLELSIAVAGQAPYPVSVTEYVPLIALGRLTSGAPLPVKVDPINPQNIIIDWSSAGPVMQAPMTATPGSVAGRNISATPGIVNQVASQGGFPTEAEMESRRQRLRQIGIRGAAVIQSATDTGQRIGSHRVIVVDMVVTIAGETTDIMASAAAVPDAYADKAVAGMIVPIKVDPADRAQLALLWEEARPPAV